MIVLYVFLIQKKNQEKSARLVRNLDFQMETYVPVIREDMKMGKHNFAYVKYFFFLMIILK